MGGATQNCPDPCKDLLAEILRFMADIQKRYWDLRNDAGNLPAVAPDPPHPRYGRRSIRGERQQYRDKQKGLRDRLDQWDVNGCGPPPDEARKWSSRAVPSADPKPSSDAVKRTAEVGAALGAGYVAYRVVRMLPSLFPPLWWTIPENAVIP